MIELEQNDIFEENEEEIKFPFIDGLTIWVYPDIGRLDELLIVLDFLTELKKIIQEKYYNIQKDTIWLKIKVNVPAIKIILVINATTDSFETSAFS